MHILENLLQKQKEKLLVKEMLFIDMIFLIRLRMIYRKDRGQFKLIHLNKWQ